MPRSISPTGSHSTFLRRMKGLLFSVLLAGAGLVALFRAMSLTEPAYAEGVSFVFSRLLEAGINATDIAVGDLNGDGALDVVFANSGAPHRVFLNDGAGGFVLASALVTGTNTTGVAVGDLDGDSALDLVFSYNGSPSQIYWNNGAGVFTVTPPISLGVGAATNAVAVADFDQNGALDIVLGNATTPSQVYLNNGNRTFTAGSTFASGRNTRSVVVGDLDGNNGPDIVVGVNGSFPSEVYLNNGGGGFLSPISVGSPAFNRGVALGDFDGSGTLDVALVSAGTGAIRVVYLNNGAGTGFPISVTLSSEAADTVAVGDVNNDGALDIVAGVSSGAPSEVYLNQNDGAGNFMPPSAIGPAATTVGVGIGDFNWDGALDLVLANCCGQAGDVYLNRGVVGFARVETVGSGAATYGFATGDFNGDGALDIVLGNYASAPRQVFLNDGVGNFLSPPTITLGISNTTSVAVGDLNGDGALDIVFGNSNQPSEVYRNNGFAAFTLTSTLGTGGATQTTAVAVGDLNGDGALDIVLANDNSGVGTQPSRIYLNDGFGAFTSGVALGVGVAASNVALGDLNRDGALDIVLAVFNQASQVYLNDGNAQFALVSTLGAGAALSTGSVTVGDVNGDGALDVVLGNAGQLSQIYQNDGTGHFTTGSALGVGEPTVGVGVGDLNGDGVLDLVLANENQPSQIYLNEGGGAFTLAGTVGGTLTTHGLALGDVNGDGVLDILLGNRNGPSQVYVNGLAQTARLPNSPLGIALSRPGLTRNAPLFSASDILSSTIIPISYTLFDLEGDPARVLTATYSLDGGGQWWPALTVSPVLTTTGLTHLFYWDTFASGFFGQSDNVVFRIEAYPSLTSGPNGVPLFQRPSASSTTFPFRVRGTQVRVFSETVATGNEVAGALVYRLPYTQTVGAFPIANGAGEAFRTDGQGYLQGRGTINISDTLVALVPVSVTDTYGVYNTNISPTLAGLSAYTVTASGVQTLTVSSAHPLVLFNLKVSLEWDARNDPAYLEQLRFNLQRASEILFDVTNGQAALGHVTIYHDHEQWTNADIRIFADNQLRPYSDIGGFVTQPVTDPYTSTIVYGPGQVTMAATWNRYGNPGAVIGEDWPRALAHELGHYLFHLWEDYLGLDLNGLIVSTPECAGTIMNQVYQDDASELRPAAGWLPDCGNTLSQAMVHRADWETVEQFYPWLIAPATPLALVNPGPSSLPLAVTQITVVEPVTPTTTLPDGRFYLSYNGGSYQPSADALGWLFRGDQLIGLGRPTVGQLNARGARPGDRVCVYELRAGRAGCKTVQAGDSQELALTVVADWTPDVRVTPVTSSTVRVQVFNLPGTYTLQAQLYDDTGYATLTQSVPYDAPSLGYSTTLTLTEPVVAGWVHLSAGANHEVVAVYSLGGNPTQKISGGTQKISGGTQKISGGAPVLSNDGQAILYTPNITFTRGEFYAIQAATHLPDVPTWLTPVSKGYWVLRSSGAPLLSSASMSIGYAESDVPGGLESFVRVYFYDGTQWTPLTTTLNTDDNTAVAPSQGAGLYVLMASIEIPLYGPGWNNIAYPIAASQTVTNALASITGTYSLVYGYVPTDTVSPWRVYAPGAPDYVNDLTTLEFGKGYWIYLITDTATLNLNGAPTMGQAAQQVGDESSVTPPATYYGAVLASAGFTPVAGQPVTAWVSGVQCGQGQTLEVNGQIVYVVKVFADEAGWSGCGAVERMVMFRVNGQPMSPAAPWDNRQVWETDLSTQNRIFLPLISK